MSITFACGVVIAVAHVLNHQFVAPRYDVAANLTAFACADAASVLLGHWWPAAFSTVAFLCWIALGVRTFNATMRSPGRARRSEGAPTPR
ncbi:hypothetical protein GCM10022242_09620 [Nocardioides panacisoli]|uniref:Uncharacterized protein n=1 Tax=Nocardioides panacisoli TaxID=627624 RepID=A0ABP7I1C9_9ACTN